MGSDRDVNCFSVPHQLVVGQRDSGGRSTPTLLSSSLLSVKDFGSPQLLPNRL